jgi:hypothetical protein
MSIKAIIQICLGLRDRKDGTGYAVCIEGEPRVNVRIGNVSIAFDYRNGYDGDADYPGIVLELAEYRDDPVRLNGTSFKDCADPAERVLRALAADLGYRIERDDCERQDVCADCLDRADLDEDGYCFECAARNE